MVRFSVSSGCARRRSVSTYAAILVPPRSTIKIFKKTLVIRRLTELVEFGRKLDEKMKAMLNKGKWTGNQ